MAAWLRGSWDLAAWLGRIFTRLRLARKTKARQNDNAPGSGKRKPWSRGRYQIAGKEKPAMGSAGLRSCMEQKQCYMAACEYSLNDRTTKLGAGSAHLSFSPMWAKVLEFGADSPEVLLVLHPCLLGMQTWWFASRQVHSPDWHNMHPPRWQLQQEAER